MLFEGEWCSHFSWEKTSLAWLWIETEDLYPTMSYVYSARNVSHESRNSNKRAHLPLELFQNLPESSPLWTSTDVLWPDILQRVARVCQTLELNWLQLVFLNQSLLYHSLCMVCELLAPLKGGGGIRLSYLFCTGRMWAIIRLRERTGCCKVTDCPDPSEPLLYKTSIEGECPTVLGYVHIYPVRVDELVI